MEADHSKKTLYVYLLLLSAICFNQTSIVGGLNYSLSDLFILSLTVLGIYKKMKIPVYHFIYFLFLSCSLILTAAFLTPILFGNHTDFSSTLKDYMKLVVVFLYYLIGYNIMNERIIKLSIKAYSYTALVIGSAGFLVKLLNISVLNDRFYYAGERLKGFMNDPNYFSIVQISALPFFLRRSECTRKWKAIIGLVIILNVILSGSKTGFITLAGYTAFFLGGKLLQNRRHIKRLFSIFIIGFLLYMINKIFHFTDHMFEKLGQSTQMQRLSLLFTDFYAALEGNGSERISTWKTGFAIIAESPFTGIGAGTYPSVAEAVSGITLVAHNTYIQFYSEWGGIFATIFFIFIFFLLIRVWTIKDLQTESNTILRDMLIILLIGSLGISFNNARMFWFFMGIFVYTTTTKKRWKNGNSDSGYSIL